MDAKVKQEILPLSPSNNSQGQNVNILKPRATATTVINLDTSSSSSSSSSDSDESDNEIYSVSKKRKLDNMGVVLPVGFLSSLSQTPVTPPPAPADAAPENTSANKRPSTQGSRQFWKAGDFEGAPNGDWGSQSECGGRIDHVRVHPKFLHSNATSHKWALGAFAELLDNALDEYANGATYVKIDMIENRKDGTKMLLIEDNGGGMDPDRMRQCMSLGYSAKSKLANTIGQYGNGFKTSTMRLGADVIVFSRCPEKDGKSPTQSIGLLSYTFLRSTAKEDIVVPMLDYEYSRERREWNRIIRFRVDDFNRNVETIAQWTPFSNETDLLRQFNTMPDQGTRIIIYNLWEDDQGLLELDFDSDPHDIQLRGANRDEKHIQMAKQYPNSKHFLTYQHSLRSYVAILYLSLPALFRIILRGKDVEHHNIVNDMMFSEKITYRPQHGADGVLNDSNMTVTVTVGFVKDAKHHIDIQGFNVYHKNRLIKPFWRLWNSASSQGRGVIGLLEANFVEPAHDKQGFERTTVLSRLETKLVQMQKNYWSKNCHRIGYYSARTKKVQDEFSDKGLGKYNTSSSKISPLYSGKQYKNGHGSRKNRTTTGMKSGKKAPWSDSSSEEDASNVEMGIRSKKDRKGSNQKSSATKFSEKDGSRGSRPPYLGDNEPLQHHVPGAETVEPVTRSQSKVHNLDSNELIISQSDLCTIDQLKEENRELKERLEKWEGESQCQLSLQCEKCISLETLLHESQQKVEELEKEQEGLLLMITEDRTRRDEEEEKLREKLKIASNTIHELLDKVKLLEKMKSK